MRLLARKHNSVPATAVTHAHHMPGYFQSGGYLQVCLLMGCFTLLFVLLQFVLYCVTEMKWIGCYAITRYSVRLCLWPAELFKSYT